MAIDYSIIVPVRNRPEAIRRCVKSLYGVDYPPTQYEVIVVDNGSTDETARAAAQSGARVISEPHANRCLARNLGASVARGRWLAFTDSDCEVDPAWLSEFSKAEKALQESNVTTIGAMAGSIIPGKAHSAVEAYIADRQWLDQKKFLTQERRYSPPFAATANLIIRSDVFKEVGGFDPEFSAGEDADWCWRADAGGWKIQYVPDAKIVHHHRASVTDMLRQAYGYGVGNAALFAKHRERWGARTWFEPQWFVWGIKGLLKSPWTALSGSNQYEKRYGWYDFLTNTAQATGRLHGAFKHRVAVI